MLKYNNNHIFTGYLKQLLSSFNLPTCKIYTREFAKHLARTGKEDPRVLESFDNYSVDGRLTETIRIGYLKNDELFNYFSTKGWVLASEVFYSTESSVKGLTRTLVSPGPNYDAATHKYLGEYLRFVRDYYNVNLLSMYNCFSDELCPNISFSIELESTAKAAITTRSFSPTAESSDKVKVVVNSLNSDYKIYRIPVKLFADYTIAIESYSDIELFCGLYNSILDTSDIGQKIIRKTYKRVRGSLFSQPFLYDSLNVKFWQKTLDKLDELCWDIAAREQDLYLFIKVPAACKSSIVVLEGDYREYNSSRYTSSKQTAWKYDQNKAILNFSKDVDLDNYEFKPISRLQLLAFNTGESYPFADRLIEYLIGSAITPIDDIHDNIIRAQRVMAENHNFFKIEGLWENKMQNILYDYMTNSGEIVTTINGETGKPELKDLRTGYHRRLGHTNKSLLFDILGYVDRDTEKTYASYTKQLDKSGKPAAQIKNTIQNVDIYNGLYDI